MENLGSGAGGVVCRKCDIEGPRLSGNTADDACDRIERETRRQTAGCKRVGRTGGDNAVLEKQRVTVLNAEQWERFVQILTNPPPPTEAMQRLMRAGAMYSWRDENGVTHTDPRFFDELSDEDKLDPH